jgi:hypothetical protein
MGLYLYQYLESLRYSPGRIYKRHGTIRETFAWLQKCHVENALGWAYVLGTRGIQLNQIQTEFILDLDP